MKFENMFYLAYTQIHVEVGNDKFAESCATTA